MTKLVFWTPGLIDMRAFTVFGFNAKPNTENPIGFFGTGLKYAVAVTARLGGKFQVFVDGVEYEFYSSKTDFRGKEFSQIRMRKRKDLLGKWNYEQLPYTTEHGKNWVPWQVYRELASNTLDENGTIEELSDEQVSNDLKLSSVGNTIIVIDHPDILAAHQSGEVFYQPEKAPLISTPELDIYEDHSHYIYYRGIRVLDLEKRSIFTYNFKTPRELTEDRTLKYIYSTEYDIRKVLVEKSTRNMVHELIRPDLDSWWEGGLPWDASTHEPSEEFIQFFSYRPKASFDTTLTGFSRIQSMMSNYTIRRQVNPEDEQIELCLTKREWREIAIALHKEHKELSEKITKEIPNLMLVDEDLIPF